MKRYIFEERNGLYIIDLAKTLQQIRAALKVVEDVVASNKTIMFVGTKKQAKSVIKDCAEQCEEFYVCERWLGGMLTNLVTIRQSIKKMEKIEKQIATGNEMGLKKKEISLLTKAHIKLDRNLSGIRFMRKPPGLLFVVDPGCEHIAVSEAKKLGIPVMALIDTNCNPDPIDYVIAGNDDALKSVRLIVRAISDTIAEKKKEMRAAAVKEAVSSNDEDNMSEKSESNEVVTEEPKGTVSEDATS